MKIVSSTVGKATNGPSRTTVVRLEDVYDERVVLQVITEADSYEPQCRVHVRVLQPSGEWGSPLVWRTATRTLGTYKGAYTPEQRMKAIEDDERHALADAIMILNAGRKEDLT
jgi:hypothetical protein